MKKQYLYVVAALVATLGLSACNDLSSPQNTVASAYSAVLKGKLGDFRETLTGKALETLGNAEGLQKLALQLANLKVTTGKQEYLGGFRHNFRHSTYSYSVEVLGREKTSTREYGRLMTAHVICEWYRGTPSHPHVGHGHVPGLPDADMDFDTGTSDFEECHISELN